MNMLAVRHAVCSVWAAGAAHAVALDCFVARAPRDDEWDAAQVEPIARKFQVSTFGLVIAARSLHVVDIAVSIFGDGNRERISAPAIVAREANMPHFSNALLTSLPPAVFEYLSPHLRTIELRRAAVIATAGEAIGHAYFPHRGVLSLVARLEGGQSVEAAMVGRDSVFGASAALGDPTALNDTVVQLPGSASILETARLRAVADRDLQFRTLLIRHEQTLFVQALQSSGCNAVHSVESRLARWLLRARDLAGGDTLDLTQENLSQVLGARRSSVSIAANTLQRAGLIRYSRGRIEIISGDGLSATSCRCYEVVRRRCDKIILKQDERRRAQILPKTSTLAN
jgi:CRP-like cAMP-binding protein